MSQRLTAFEVRVVTAFFANRDVPLKQSQSILESDPFRLHERDPIVGFKGFEHPFDGVRLRMPVGVKQIQKVDSARSKIPTDLPKVAALESQVCLSMEIGKLR
jgi:hypothetical protein